jgi:hypothetical protein
MGRGFSQQATMSPGISGGNGKRRVRKGEMERWDKSP